MRTEYIVAWGRVRESFWRRGTAMKVAKHFAAEQRKRDDGAGVYVWIKQGGTQTLLWQSDWRA